jgi:hypothetical protein
MFKSNFQLFKQLTILLRIHTAELEHTAELKPYFRENALTTRKISNRDSIEALFP